MHAQIIRSFGDAGVFERATLPDPVPLAGQVLVRQEATSVNPVDYKIRRFGPPIAPELPAILGCDVSGRVVALGEGVTRFKVGDAVYGCAGGVRGVGGAYADLIAADARLLARRPAGLDAREAAALPLVTITAWEGLDRAGVAPGQSVLVHGGAGGVGHVAIQLAKARGARVFATVSSGEKAGIARELGADVTINYREVAVDDYVAQHTGGRGFDVVFDTTGGSDIATSFAAAKLNGQVVTIVSQYEADLSLMHVKGLSLHVVFMLIPMLHDIGREAHGALLDQAARLVEQGRLRPLIDARRFSLEDVAEAHHHAESGRAIGKVVIDIGNANAA